MEFDMIKSFEELRSNMKTTPKTLVVAAANDEHTLEAVYTAARELPMQLVLIGDREKIISISSKLEIEPDQDNIIDCKDNTECAHRAVALVKNGDGDVLMKGSLDTRTLLKAVVNREYGVRSSGIMSHLAILEVPSYHKLIGITDGGMVPNPTLGQKANIVRNAVVFFEHMGYERPMVAALCAAEAYKTKIPETVDAADLQTMSEKGELGNCVLEGPLSFDIAISRESATLKGFSSEISGNTDILLVPNITSGNIMAKGIIYMAGAKMAGCVLGAQVPIVVTSRGATAEEKFNSILMSLI